MQCHQNVFAKLLTSKYFPLLMFFSLCKIFLNVHMCTPVVHNYQYSIFLNVNDIFRRAGCGCPLTAMQTSLYTTRSYWWVKFMSMT